MGTLHFSGASPIEASVISVERLRTIWPVAKIDAAARILGRSETILLLGLGRSFPLACYLAYSMSNLGMKVVLIDHVSAPASGQIAASGPDDALVAISFSPIRR